MKNENLKKALKWSILIGYPFAYLIVITNTQYMNNPTIVFITFWYMFFNVCTIGVLYDEGQ